MSTTLRSFSIRKSQINYTKFLKITIFEKRHSLKKTLQLALLFKTLRVPPPLARNRVRSLILTYGSMFSPNWILPSIGFLNVPKVFIQYDSLANWTNGSLLLTFSIGKKEKSLWGSWPSPLKWTPTGLSVSTWEGQVALPKCFLALSRTGLLSDTTPTYVGPPTLAQGPVSCIPWNNYFLQRSWI